MIPEHVGIVLDGNRRWARQRGLPASDGHRAGFSRIPQVLGWCETRRLRYVTLWMLSTENLRREAAEVASLMEIITYVALDLAGQPRWTIRHVGDAGQLPPPVVRALRHAEERTARGERTLTVNLAVAYGGRAEIVMAVRALARDAQRDGLSPAGLAKSLTPDDLTRVITCGQPAPALIIRTSGEQRGSGFLLWSGADALWWFTSSYWPAFTSTDLSDALDYYRKAQHR
ncbi:polyprenyl diphosphate synthase [Streptomyces albireticuli]|uniref:polyprenyl diphosphate synthase n=1 Tax=Streptomyces albireticuli TaxID=1940 RepID=UPI0036846BEC